MGPLAGVRVVEVAGIGPGPVCGMVLADLGADVVRVARLRGGRASHAVPVLGRGRRSIALDLKIPAAIDVALRLVARSDALIEGFRPGAMEALGLGPEPCLAAKPALVYGRLTGYGREGPLAREAGHDIDYIALTGALHAVGEADRRPVPPVNLVGDFGGGAMLLAVGLLAALVEARASGRGQVVDAAMTDGSALLMTLVYELKGLGVWQNARGANPFDGGAPFYGTYACADGRYLALGAYEDEFCRALLDGLGIRDARFANHWDRSQWPALREAIAVAVATRTRDEWCTAFAGSEACVAPVLDLDEAPRHPQNVARGTFTAGERGPVPAAAPRFSRTVASASPGRCEPGGATESVLRELGYDDQEIAALRAAGAC